MRTMKLEEHKGDLTAGALTCDVDFTAVGNLSELSRDLADHVADMQLDVLENTTCHIWPTAEGGTVAWLCGDPYDIPGVGVGLPELIRELRTFTDVNEVTDWLTKLRGVIDEELSFHKARLERPLT